MGNIWLIGGTSESADLARALAKEQIPCTVSVTTSSAQALYPSTPILEVRVGRLTFDKLHEFLHQQQIVAVVDASHPFAVEISKNAIARTQQLQIPYLRYERPVLLETQRHGEGETRGLKLIYLDNLNTLVCGNYLNNQRVLLTVGYKYLPMFLPWQERATLFARLLPSVTALEAADQAGFTPDRIICLRPPISAELEMALWRQWEISLVVTKASGTAGGEDVKRKVAASLGVPLVVISRPEVAYPQQTSDLAAVLEFCRKYAILNSVK